MAWCYTGVCPAVEHPNGPEVWSALLTEFAAESQVSAARLAVAPNQASAACLNAELDGTDAPWIPRLGGRAPLGARGGPDHRLTDAFGAGSGGTTSVTSTGFLPRHPVKLAIDGTVITTLTADDHGVVGYPLNPAALGLKPGHHVLTLQGMLITTTASFRS